MTHPQQAPHGFRRFLCNSCGHFIDVPIHCSSKACGVCTAIRGWRIRERIQYALQGMKQDRVYRWRQVSIRDGSNIGYYISKYITKVHTLSAASIVTLDEICRNRRLFGPFGKCALLMKKFRPPDKFYPCPTCGVHEWIPEFILDMMNRRATQFT